MHGDTIDPSTAALPGVPSRLGELHLAFAFLTRLPLPPVGMLPNGVLAPSMWVFPLVGAAVGAIGAGVYALADVALPKTLAALLAIAATILVTGAMHEDGLADVADGFGGGADRDAKLAIMKDSRIGSFGLLAVTLGLLLRVGALASLASPGLVAGAMIAAHALSRATIPVVMQGLMPARQTGLGASAGQPDVRIAGIAATVGLAIAALVLPVGAAVAASSAAALAAAVMAGLALQQVGGQTGDVLGAVEQLAETAALLAAVATL